jgi:hypothetical protein
MVKMELGVPFVGVPEELLADIGRIVVLGAHLEYTRLMLLDNATRGARPIKKLAALAWPDATREIKEAFNAEPFDRLGGQVNAWLDRVNDLIEYRHTVAHSMAYYEFRGDGTTGYGNLQPRKGQSKPQFTREDLKDIVARMVKAHREGHSLWIEVIVIREDGPGGHDAFLEQRRQAEVAMQQWEAMS